MYVCVLTKKSKQGLGWWLACYVMEACEDVESVPVFSLICHQTKGWCGQHPSWSPFLPQFQKETGVHFFSWVTRVPQIRFEPSAFAMRDEYIYHYPIMQNQKYKIDVKDCITCWIFFSLSFSCSTFLGVLSSEVISALISCGNVQGFDLVHSSCL